MCKGTVTDLKCGHRLVHFASRCARGCAEPSGPRAAVDDTCAACDCRDDEREILRQYNDTRAFLAAEIRAARLEARSGDVAELERRNWKEYLAMRLKVSEERLKNGRPKLAGR